MALNFAALSLVVRSLVVCSRAVEERIAFAGKVRFSVLSLALFLSLMYGNYVFSDGR